MPLFAVLDSGCTFVLPRYYDMLSVYFFFFLDKGRNILNKPTSTRVFLAILSASLLSFLYNNPIQIS